MRGIDDVSLGDGLDPAPTDGGKGGKPIERGILTEGDSDTEDVKAETAQTSGGKVEMLEFNEVSRYPVAA